MVSCNATARKRVRSCDGQAQSSAAARQHARAVLGEGREKGGAALRRSCLVALLKKAILYFFPLPHGSLVSSNLRSGCTNRRRFRARHPIRRRSDSRSRENDSACSCPSGTLRGNRSRGPPLRQAKSMRVLRASRSAGNLDTGNCRCKFTRDRAREAIRIFETWFRICGIYGKVATRSRDSFNTPDSLNPVPRISCKIVSRSIVSLKTKRRISKIAVMRYGIQRKIR